MKEVFIIVNEKLNPKTCILGVFFNKEIIDDY